MRTSLHALILVGLLAGLAEAMPMPGTCQFTAISNRSIAPVAIDFPIALSSPVAAAVTVDAQTGAFTFDGGSVVVPPYPFPFSEANDVMTWADSVFTGTIDSSGTVNVVGVRFTVCTFGTPAGENCVPGNLCSNDVTLPCIPGPGGGSGCAAGGVCQGVCRGNQTQTCAGDADCGPGGFCGTGRLTPFAMTLTTGPSRFGDIVVDGTPLDFGTGSMTLVNVGQTPPESPVIGDTGVSALILTCTLSPIPDQASLPPPPTWASVKGSIKLGKGGANVADDRLKLKGVFTPIGGAATFDTDALELSIGTADATVVTLEIPAGALRANKKGTKLTLKDTTGTVGVAPPLPGGAVAHHVLGLKHRKKGGYVLTLTSTGLRLDGLAGPEVATAVTLGVQHAAATGSTHTKGRLIGF